jgi:DNA-binding beta-propeller fold protein YncE
MDGKSTLLFVTIITALHFTDKATSYIFTAELMIFLAIIFITRIITKTWQSKSLRSLFLIVVTLTLLIGLAAFVVSYNALTNAPTSQDEESVGVMFSEIDPSIRLLIGGLILGLLVGVGFAAYLLIKGIGWFGIRDERSFDLLIMQGTIVLPLLAALPMDLLGFNPLDYSSNGILTSAFFVLPLFILALLIGLWWNWKLWALNIGVFWSIFIVFYTTLFTQGSGFFMGLMGALGYWIAQQGVTRGTQPLYYYALVQIPMYEFLPAFGTLLAGIMAIPILGKSLSKLSQTKETQGDQEDLDEDINQQLPFEEENLDKDIEIDLLVEEDALSTPIDEEIEVQPQTQFVDNEGEVRQPPILALLLYWSVMSLVAFSFAGERMPWLTTHIAMPLILTSGWSFGKLLESFEWSVFKRYRGWLVVILGALFLLTSFRTFGVLLGPTPPFQGRELAQLESTSTFLLALIGMLASGIGLSYLLREWTFKQIGKFALIVFIAILSIITVRTAFRANFILYDTAKEFLVYAHAARDPKDALAQIEEISHRLTGGKDLVVAYDSDLLYPYWWYFRDYPNKRWYAQDPTRDLRDAPIILVGSGNYGKIDPVVSDDYIQFDYQRLWWPSQAYYNLSFKRVWDALINNEMRAALWEIWFNRNYKPYATLTNTDTLTLENWQPSDSFRMYIRKDVVSQIWEYGAAPITLEPTVDPYEANTISPEAEKLLYGGEGFQFDSPRDIAFAQDGTIYVADSRNHRILHLDQEGQLLHSWGTFAASDYSTNVMAPPGTFNEPWGLGIGSDGSVYVADTWNNRIQKFTSVGEFVTMWGQFGAAETPYHFWGPRDIAVDDQGRIFVTDTGNKRIVIFDSDGNNLGAFGGAGLGIGQFDEPVGITVDDQGRLYIADTWNMRIQIMIPAGETLSYPTHITWDIDAWFSDSLDNKPFLAIDEDYNTYVGDPVMGRVLIFDQQGNFLQAFGGFGSGPTEIGIVGGLAIDPEGKVWVADARNNRLMRFSLLDTTTEGQPLTEGEIEMENPLEDELNILPTE